MSLARHDRPSGTAALQASQLFGETGGVWAITTYLEQDFPRFPLTKQKKPHKIKYINDFEGKKDGISRLQRAGGCCEPVGEFCG